MKFHDTPDDNHHLSTTAEHADNWDDDFEVQTQNYSARKRNFSTPGRRDVSCKFNVGGDETLQVGSRIWDDSRIATARSRRALPLRILLHHRLCRSSPLITNTHRLNYFFVLQLPMCFPSQIPPCLWFPSMSDVQLRFITPFSAHTQRTRKEAVKEEEPSPPRGENLVGRYGRALFFFG
jgi:hypothetical protein